MPDDRNDEVPFISLAEGSTDAAVMASWNRLRQDAFQAAVAGRLAMSGDLDAVLLSIPVLLTRSVVTPYQKTAEGYLVRAVTTPLREVISVIERDRDLIYKIDPRKWEEIIAGAYEQSGQFDEVTLTPRSGDKGRDVIAVKKGFGSVRLLESVKRYKPGHVVTAEEVQALLGVVLSDPQASKGIVSTTWEFAPRITENANITQYIPNRLELVDRSDLLRRLREYSVGEGKKEQK